MSFGVPGGRRRTGEALGVHWNRAWRPFIARAGYEWGTFRTFRRIAATLLDEAGLTARQIADLLGHSRPSMTQDVYMGRRSPGHGAADALGAAITVSEG
jgi:integrase